MIWNFPPKPFAAVCPQSLMICLLLIQTYFVTETHSDMHIQILIIQSMH